MRIRSVRIILVAVASGTIAGGARAQAIGQQRPVAVELARVVAGQSRIRVRLASGTMVELRHAVVDGTTLLGRPTTGDSLVGYRVEELDRVWRRGSAARLGLAIGASVGLVGGAIGGAALANFCTFICSGASDGEVRRAAVIGGLVGGVTVGTVGLLVGAPFGRWKTAYTAQRQRLSPIITTHRLGVSLAF